MNSQRFIDFNAEVPKTAFVPLEYVKYASKICLMCTQKLPNCLIQKISG